ncbi:kinase-like protein [Trichoderma novae-zelandiae]
MALSAGPGMLAAPAPAPVAPVPAPEADKCAQSLQCASDTTSYCNADLPPRQPPIDLPDPILEGDETESEGPIEPVTPTSGRQSQDFTSLRNAHDQDQDQDDRSSFNTQSDQALHQQRPAGALTSANKAAILSSPSRKTAPVEASAAALNLAPAPRPTSSSLLSPASAAFPVSAAKPGTASSSELARTNSNSNRSLTDLTPTSSRPSFQEPPPPSRRSARLSTSSIKSTMTNFFRRPGAQDAPVFESGSPTPSESSYLHRPLTSNARPATRSSRFSFTRPSNTTTRSVSPPSPTMAASLDGAQADQSSLADEDLLTEAEFKKKNRASTGLSLRGRAVDFVGTTVGRTTGRPNKIASRRANSFDAGNRGPLPHQHANMKPVDQMYPPERLPWALPPDVGTGAKARRMSLSLPDDFNVDVAVLQDEFEYQSKLLGRHGKHLGKGAASKVSLMVRKGFPTEMYAVKEFRGKSGRESKEEYEKKIKSEFSIGKSLHHPNIVETVRLCTDHGRWNHVMEYCSEGDLFSLVQKGHLKGEAKLKDRLCLFKQLIQGVNYLHANGIAHRDIKLENLLITKDSKLKITDFGVSEVFCGTHPGLRESGGQCGRNMGEIRLCSPGLCGSEPYIAPEVLQKKGAYDPRALDVWSAAIVMIYMTFGGAIWSRAEAGNLHYDKLVAGWKKWNKKHEGEENATITDTDYPYCQALDIGVNPPALRRILLQMLNPDPNSRISIYEVITNRWVKNVECCQLESYDDPKHTIDVTKKDYGGKNGSKIFCHNHLPPKSFGSHSLGKMPGQPGY